MRRLNEQELQQFITLWNKGYNCQQISLVMPFNKITLYYYAYRILIEDGRIEPHKAGSPIKNKCKYVREAYLQGMTNIKQLAERFNISEQTVYCYLTPLKRSNASKDLKVNIIKQLQEHKLSQSEIARQYGVSRQYVYIVKNEMKT